jgi:hypothetical protein
MFHCGTIPCFEPKIFLAPLPPFLYRRERSPKILPPWQNLLYLGEGSLLPIETPPCFDEVDIPLLITINHFTI